jgi:hypothetical protein
MIYLGETYMPKASNRPAAVRIGSQRAAAPEGATGADVRENWLSAEFSELAGKAGHIPTLIVGVL